MCNLHYIVQKLINSQQSIFSNIPSPAFKGRDPGLLHTPYFNLLYYTELSIVEQYDCTPTNATSIKYKCVH